MRLDGFGLFVEDMAKMIRFYRDVLGFEIKESEDTSNVYLVKDMCHIRAFLYAKNNDIDNAIESIKQGYENSEIPQVIIDKLVQIANG